MGRKRQEWALALTGSMGADTWGSVSACWRGAFASSSAFVSSGAISILLSSDLYADVAAKAAQLLGDIRARNSIWKACANPLNTPGCSGVPRGDAKPSGTSAALIKVMESKAHIMHEAVG